MHRTGTHRPIIGVIFTVCLAVLFYYMGDNETVDRITAFNVAISFLLSSLVIFVLTEDWYWRAVAVAIALGATGLTYAIIFGHSADFWDINTLVTRSILRAGLNFGGVVLGVCVVAYLWNRRQTGEREPFFDFIDPRKRYRGRVEQGD